MNLSETYNKAISAHSIGRRAQSLSSAKLPLAAEDMTGVARQCPDDPARRGRLRRVNMLGQSCL